MIETELFKTKFIPALKPSKKLMLVLHGRGDSLRPFKDFHEELNIPDMNYLLINAPRKFMTGYSWYGEPPYQKAGVLKIREKMFQLLQEIEDLGWLSKNIYLFGFSQGCLVSADVALHYPKRLGGVVGISGYFYFFPRWRTNLTQQSKKTPWLLTHGHKDDILPIQETRYGVRKLRQAGLKVDWIELKKKHVLEESEYPLIRRWISGRQLAKSLHY